MMSIELIALQKLSKAFDQFMDECLDENRKPKTPTPQAVAKARGCLPPYCKHAYRKKAANE